MGLGNGCLEATFSKYVGEEKDQQKKHFLPWLSAAQHQFIFFTFAKTYINYLASNLLKCLCLAIWMSFSSYSVDHDDFFIRRWFLFIIIIFSNICYMPDGSWAFILKAQTRSGTSRSFFSTVRPLSVLEVKWLSLFSVRRTFQLQDKAAAAAAADAIAHRKAWGTRCALLKGFKQGGSLLDTPAVQPLRGSHFCFQRGHFCPPGA